MKKKNYTGNFLLKIKERKLIFDITYNRYCYLFGVIDDNELEEKNKNSTMKFMNYMEKYCLINNINMDELLNKKESV